MHAASIRETRQTDSGQARADLPALASSAAYACRGRDRQPALGILRFEFVLAAQFGRSKAPVFHLPIVEGGLADPKPSEELSEPYT
jgi:hypothetical protein